jgi:hypothetical protein
MERRAQQVNENPYAPPAAKLEVVPQPEPEVARPRIVGYAITLMWISLGVGLVNSLTVLPSLNAMARATSLIVGIILGLAGTLLLTAWITVKMAAGRHWARVLMLVLAILSLPFFIPKIPLYIHQGLLRGVLVIAVYVLQCAAVILVFLPAARPWYRRRKDP